MNGQRTPSFIIEHEMEIHASADATWAVLADLSSYPEWNPYILELDGTLSPGSTLSVTIIQADWNGPITVEPTVIEAIPGRILHWRGELGEPGVLDTDHGFEIHHLGDRIRFHQYEQFGGTIAETIDEATRACTRDAFEAMNEALAARVEGLQTN